MKLYTEIQLLEAIDRAIFSKQDINSFDILEDLIPIELPSDEDIEESCNRILIVDKYQDIWKFGAIWMRDKIQGGNK